VSFDELVRTMVDADLERYRRLGHAPILGGLG
jgi:hypothetical protein